MGLSRKFRIMDDDGSGALSVAEFKKAMRECSLELSDEVRIFYCECNARRTFECCFLILTVMEMEASTLMSSYMDCG